MTQEVYTVYALAECNTYLVYYVGVTAQHYLQRFRNHWSSSWKIQELLEQGIDLLAYPLYQAETEKGGREYELRWICHCIQQRQPLVNHEVQDEVLVNVLQQSSIDFINLAHEVHIWKECILPLMRTERQRARSVVKSRETITGGRNMPIGTLDGARSNTSTSGRARSKRSV